MGAEERGDMVDMGDMGGDVRLHDVVEKGVGGVGHGLTLPVGEGVRKTNTGIISTTLHFPEFSV